MLTSKYRLVGWLVASVVIAAVVFVLQPQQLLVTVYKLGLVTTAGVLGYWLDRSLFPYGRPDAFLTKPAKTPNGNHLAGLAVSQQTYLVFCACMLRRAVIVLGAMLAVSMGA